MVFNLCSKIQADVGLCMVLSIVLFDDSIVR